MGGKITLYIDIISPFGWLSFWLVRHSPAFKNVQVSYMPILLGGLHKLCNNTAPIFIKNKDKWINIERERWAEQFQIPLRKQTPAQFPVSTVNAQRVLCAVDQVAPEKMGDAVEALWQIIWYPEGLRGRDGGAEKLANGEYDVKDVKTLERILSHSSVLGGQLASKVCGMIGEKTVKDALGTNTQKAFEAGAFGLPWFSCENEDKKEGFWGFDHIGQVARFLGVDIDADLQRSGQKLRAVL